MFNVVMKNNSRFLLPLLLMLAAQTAWPLSAQEVPSAAKADEPPSIDDLLPLPVEAAEDSVSAAEQASLTPAAQSRVQLSESFAINLVNRLVERGVLTQADAADMINLAKADAAVAAQEREALFTAAQTAAEAPPASDEDVRVTYIPEVVKDEMRSQIKSELLREAEEKKWLAPKYELPHWVSNFHPHAEFRIRYESISFPGGNSNTGAYPNFNAINTGPAYDETGALFAPQLNTDQDRERARLLLRFGAQLDLDDNFTLGIRLGTGDTNNPVSGNQSLGYANQGPGGAFQQQGGQFSKYAIWLDRAFLKWEPVDSISISVGRFDNPFFSTTAIYSDDLGFDGLVLQAHHEVYEGIDPFLVIGTFPIFNTDLHFGSNQPAKFESRDKWLNAAQIGVDWKISKDWNLKLATAYYDFRNVEGQLSSPYVPRSIDDPGDTDHTRPSFAQKGNTYRRLRRIIADATNNFGTINQFQYYGLATPFRIHSITGRLDYNGYEPVQVSLLGEYLRNTAFDASTLKDFAVNNRGAGGNFDGGDTAYYVNLRVGKPLMEKRGDWFAYLGYRHVESDAVIDGFNDQDFGGGGTNMKGYSLGAAIALSPRVQLGLRYFSASQIAGPQFKSDIIQLDLSAKF
jgi:hypothetical protein